MIQYNEQDQPNKYGFTKKERDIWELIYTGKSLEEGGFDITEEDREFYSSGKNSYELKRAYLGHDFRFEHFVNDID